MKRRLFFGISLPQNVSKAVNRKIAGIQDLPVIWTSEENRHITLLFLGWVDDVQLGDIVLRATEACAETGSFDASIDRIVVAPEKNPDRIEATGEGNEDLCHLANVLSSKLQLLSSDRKSFRPHITLGRIRRRPWKALPANPVVNIPVRFSVPVLSVSLFESAVIDGKRKYVSIETIDLG